MQSRSGPTLHVTDLDFTLLRSDKRLAGFTVDVVNRVVAAGHHVTFATARGPSSALRVTDGLRLELPVVAYGGAMTVDPASGDHLHVRPIAADAVEAICSVVGGSRAVEPVLFALVDGRDRICWRDAHTTAPMRAFLADRAGDPRLLPISSWSDVPLDAVFYATVIGGHADVTATHDALAQHLDPCFRTLGPDGYRPDQTWLEICSSDATKAAAVGHLRDDLGAAELVVFGDNLNDVPMFGIADHRCAVANAVPEILALADEVIAANDDDGVARWLAEHLLDGPAAG